MTSTKLCNNNSPSLAAVVTETDILDKSKDGAAYLIIVSYGENKLQVKRRLSDFLALYEKLKELCPDVKLKLPAKRQLLFGALGKSKKHFREGLQVFVENIITNQQLNKHAEVHRFLDIEISSASTSRSDDSDEMDHDMSKHRAMSASSAFNFINIGSSEITHARQSDFEFLKVIGKGSFGKVLLAKHKLEGKLYAIKVLNKVHIMKKNEVKHIMSERNVLVTNIRHPFLVSLHYSFQTRDKLYFVLDYVNGGELFRHLQKEGTFAEPRARFYAAEIASALGFLHSCNILYRDLKPENILLDSQGHIVLTDFGLCKEGMEGEQTTSTFCGTPEYLAPEVLRKQPYDRTVDWWCLGIVLYEMMSGLPPFYSRETATMYDNILHRPLQFRNNIAMSNAARHIIEGLLHKDKRSRLGVKNDFEDIRSHPFFATVDWLMLESKKIKPPYNPNVSGPLDFKHIDPEFVEEPVPNSIEKAVVSSTTASGASDSVQRAAAAFQGFSYIPAVDDV